MVKDYICEQEKEHRRTSRDWLSTEPCPKPPMSLPALFSKTKELRSFASLLLKHNLQDQQRFGQVTST